jgi:hypothetical protein
MNHYDWLDKYFPKFLAKLGIDFDARCPGIIIAHGDKCYTFKYEWKRAGIPFHYGVAIYLLTYLRPWSNAINQRTINGWIHPCDWVITEYKRFESLLKEVDDEIQTNERMLKIMCCDQCPYITSEKLYTPDPFENVQRWRCTKYDKVIADIDATDKKPSIPEWCEPIIN